MTANVKALDVSIKVSRGQSGVALIQALLLSMLFSILAVQFSQTARDQIEIADRLDDRFRAQLRAYSAANEAIFLRLSSTVQSISTSSGHPTVMPDAAELNFYGRPIEWREGVKVILQDLNGLLPQLYPDNMLWYKLLAGLSMEKSEIDRYLATWQDTQDPDLRDRLSGTTEPKILPSGQAYLNGYAQDDSLIQWIFHDKIDLIPELLAFSDINSPPEQNLYNAPDELLGLLLEPEISSAIIAARDKGMSYAAVGIDQMLPSDLNQDHLVRGNSRAFRLIVEVKHDESIWRTVHVVFLAASSDPPFEIVFNQ